MKYLITVLFIALSLGLCVSVSSSPVRAQTSDTRQQLIEKFRANSKSDHKAAYEAAKEFFQKYPDDTSEDAQFMRRWMAAYEKVEMNGQPSSSSGSQPTSNRGNSSPPTETETPEIAEARIAITKYKDYQGAIKSLESSSSETKRKSLWLFYMAIAQEGVGNEVEELRYLEKYNELVPNQKETVEKLADLRYRVKKKRAADDEKAEKEKKEFEEENRYGTLEQTVDWLTSKYLRDWTVDKQTLTLTACFSARKTTSCWSVPLTALDTNAEILTLPNGRFNLHFICLNDKECVSAKNKYSKQPVYFKYQDFNFDSQDTAREVSMAIRHAIRLMQQGRR